MKLDKNENPYVDFKAISDTEPLKGGPSSDKGTHTMVSHASVTEMIDLAMAMPGSEPVIQGNTPTQTIHLCYGAWHQHRDDPVLPVCMFCQRVRWLLEETAVDYRSCTFALVCGREGCGREGCGREGFRERCVG